MIGNKIKALLNLKNKTTNDVCESLQIIDTAYYRKIKKNTFKAEELIILADLADAQLCYVDKETGKILVSFDIEDIKKDARD